MQTHDTNSCAAARTNNQIITPKHRAAFARLEEASMQLEELKSLTWMMDETSQRLSDWDNVVSSISLLHRQIRAMACAIDGVRDDLDSLFLRAAPAPAKATGGASC